MIKLNLACKGTYLTLCKKCLYVQHNIFIVENIQRVSSTASRPVLHTMHSLTIYHGCAAVPVDPCCTQCTAWQYITGAQQCQQTRAAHNAQPDNISRVHNSACIPVLHTLHSLTIYHGCTTVPADPCCTHCTAWQYITGTQQCLQTRAALAAIYLGAAHCTASTHPTPSQPQLCGRFALDGCSSGP